jgi:hypothetical protein
MKNRVLGLLIGLLLIGGVANGAWDETKPTDTGLLKDAPAQIRANWDAIALGTDADLQITNAKVSASAGIVDTKLAQLSTAGKVAGSALTTFSTIPSGAGLIPDANLSHKLKADSGDTTPQYLDGLIDTNDFQISAGDLLQIKDSALTGITTLAYLTTTGNLWVQANASVAGTLGVTGATGITGTLTLAKDLSVNKDFTVGGNIYSNSRVSPMVYANNLTTSGVLKTDSVVTSQNIKICQGYRTVGGETSATVTGLPFTSNSVYHVVLTLGENNTLNRYNMKVNRDSGSQFTIYNPNGASLNCNWIAVGT